MSVEDIQATNYSLTVNNSGSILTVNQLSNNVLVQDNVQNLDINVQEITNNYTLNLQQQQQIINVPQNITQVVTVSTGLNGQGVPSGGTTGQILAKNSNNNYDTKWENLPSSGVTQYGNVASGNIAVWQANDSIEDLGIAASNLGLLNANNTWTGTNHFSQDLYIDYGLSSGNLYIAGHQALSYTGSFTQVGDSLGATTYNSVLDDGYGNATLNGSGSNHLTLNDNNNSYYQLAFASNGSETWSVGPYYPASSDLQFYNANTGSNVLNLGFYDNSISTSLNTLDDGSGNASFSGTVTMSGGYIQAEGGWPYQLQFTAGSGPVSFGAFGQPTSGNMVGFSIPSNVVMGISAQYPRIGFGGGNYFAFSNPDATIEIVYTESGINMLELNSTGGAAGDLLKVDGSGNFTNAGSITSGADITAGTTIKSTGNFTYSAGLYGSVTAKTSNYTVTSNDSFVLMKANGATVTLPTPSAHSNQYVEVGTWYGGGGSNYLVGNINGTTYSGTSFIVPVGYTYSFFCDGSTWNIVAAYTNTSSLVIGAASSTIGNLPSFATTNGKQIQDSGVAAASVVTGPASATSGNIPTFNGTTGKIIQDGSVLLSNVAVKNAANTFTTGAQFLNGAVLASAIYDNGSISGGTTLHLEYGNYQKMTIGNSTALFFTSPAYYGRWSFMVIQDGTGVRTPTFPGITAWLGLPPKINYGAGAVTFFDIIWTGSAVYGIAMNDSVLSQANSWQPMQTFQQATFSGTYGNAVFFSGATYCHFTDLGTVNGTVSLNLQTNNRFTMVMNGNTTLTFGVGPSSTDAFVQAYMYQDGTGGRNLTIGTSVLWIGGTPTFSTAANSCTLISLIYDSARGKWLACGKSSS